MVLESTTQHHPVAVLTVIEYRTGDVIVGDDSTSICQSVNYPPMDNLAAIFSIIVDTIRYDKASKSLVFSAMDNSHRYVMSVEYYDGVKSIASMLRKYLSLGSVKVIDIDLGVVKCAYEDIISNDIDSPLSEEDISVVGSLNTWEEKKEWLENNFLGINYLLTDDDPRVVETWDF